MPINTCEVFMGNRTSLCLLFAYIFFVTTDGWAVAAWDKTDCTNQQVSYLGQNILGGGKKICVTQKGNLIDDGEAKLFCAKNGFSRFLNLANTDYAKAGAFIDEDAVADSGKKGKMYLCFNGGVRKADICRQVSLDPKNKSLKMQWKPDGPNGHGYCQCDKDGSSSSVNCDGPTVPVVAAAESNTACKSPEEISDGKGGCVCSSGYEKTRQEGQPPTYLCTKTVDAVVTGEPHPELKTCLDNFEEKSKQCKDSAKLASEKCDAGTAASSKDIPASKNRNSEVQSAGAIMDMAGQVMIAKGAGKGDTMGCFAKGSALRASKQLLSELKAKCDENKKTCETTCSDETINNEKLKCEEILNKIVSGANQNENGEVVTSNQNYFQNRVKEVSTAFAEGNKACTDRTEEMSATNLENGFDKLLKNIASSFQQAAICACQVASTALTGSSGSCSSVPTAAECAANPSLAGCEAYNLVDACNMSSSAYNAQVCACQKDSAGVTCKTATAAGPSGFAGPDAKTASSSGNSNFGTTGGNVADTSGGGNFSFGSALDNGALSPIKPQTATPGGGGGAAGGGAGGGASAPPAGGAGDGGGGIAGEDSHGMGGLLNQAKSFMGSLFGNGSNKNGQGLTPGKGGEPGVNYDINKFRPIRGMASEGQFGKRNSDIWKTMNTRYQLIQPTLPSSQ